MLKPEVVEALKKRLPEDMWPRAIVAGGYAADPDRAADIDLWVIGGDMEVDAMRIRKHNHMSWFSLAESPYEQFSNEFAVVTKQGVEVKLGSHSTTFLPVQILVSSAKNFGDLLERFDISTHQVGISLEPEIAGRHRLVKGSKFTETTVQPRVIAWTRPEQTIRRLEKVTSRYGFQPHPDDMKQLLAAMPPIEVFEEEIPF